MFCVSLQQQYSSDDVHISPVDCSMLELHVSDDVLDDVLDDDLFVNDSLRVTDRGSDHAHVTDEADGGAEDGSDFIGAGNNCSPHDAYRLSSFSITAKCSGRTSWPCSMKIRRALHGRVSVRVAKSRSSGKVSGSLTTNPDGAPRWAKLTRIVLVWGRWYPLDSHVARGFGSHVG
jgi:hypothetical protein